jgi:F0F1-type ATP synthase membrane subunit b/b'
MLQHTVTRDRRTVECVEKNLLDAKQDTTELRLLNQDLQEEVQRLKIQVQELREKL